MNGIMDTGYLYGQLNNYIEYITPEFQSTDTITVGSVDGNPNKINLQVNTNNLVILKEIIKDESHNSRIKYYGLYAYNPNTKQYDIRLQGPELIIDTSLANPTERVETVYVQVGEKIIQEPVLDDAGNPILDPDGNQVFKDVIQPIYDYVTIKVNPGTGAIHFSSIPANMVVDYKVDADGQRSYISSLVDGNIGGEVY